jgi:hypothetical protein
VRSIALGFPLALLILPPSLILAAPPERYTGLPDDAILLEEQSLPVSAHPNRALLLWVWPSQEKPLHWRTRFVEMGSIPEDDEDGYTCPEQATGHSHYFHTRTRVSLVDTQTRKILNTLPVQLDPIDEFDIPTLIRPGYFYEVPGPVNGSAGRPHIFALKDFNGDGKALEFAFYWMESCTGPQTMVLGYSQRQDRVILYKFLLRDHSSGHEDAEIWMLRFTSQKPISPMHWRYDDLYNSGDDIKYDFQYIPQRERFEGTKLETDAPIDLRNLQKKK